MTYLQELAAVARVGDKRGYAGTREHLAAFNDFLETLAQYLASRLTADEASEFDSFCHFRLRSMDSMDEVIDEGLRLADREVLR